MNRNKLFIVSAVSVMLLGCGGCPGPGVSVIPIPGTGIDGIDFGRSETYYSDNTLQSHLKYKPDEVAKATEKAFKTLKISKVSSKVLAVSAEVIGKTSNDVKVSVNVEAEEGGSKITIRFGVFGDETQSTRILDEIKKNLYDAAKK